jgi:ketosteroid isomerase-like protein
VGSTWFESESAVLRVWRQAIDSILSGDVELARSTYAPDATFYDPYVGTVRGRDEIALQLGGMKGTAFDEATVEVSHAYADEHGAAIEWVQHMKAQGHDIRVEVASFVTVEGGQITRHCDYLQPLKNRKP